MNYIKLNPGQSVKNYKDELKPYKEMEPGDKVTEKEDGKESKKEMLKKVHANDGSLIVVFLEVQ